MAVDVVRTKPITALAIAQVWERGKIALDDRGREIHSGVRHSW